MAPVASAKAASNAGPAARRVLDVSTRGPNGTRSATAHLEATLTAAQQRLGRGELTNPSFGPKTAGGLFDQIAPTQLGMAKAGLDRVPAARVAVEASLKNAVLIGDDGKTVFLDALKTFAEDAAGRPDSIEVAEVLSEGTIQKSGSGLPLRLRDKGRDFTTRDAMIDHLVAIRETDHHASCTFIAEAIGALEASRENRHLSLAGETYVALAGCAELSTALLMAAAGADVYVIDLHAKGLKAQMATMRDQGIEFPGAVRFIQSDLLAQPLEIASTIFEIAKDTAGGKVHLGAFPFATGHRRALRLQIAVQGIFEAVRPVLKSFGQHRPPSIASEVDLDTAAIASDRFETRGSLLRNKPANILYSEDRRHAVAQATVTGQGSAYWGAQLGKGFLETAALGGSLLYDEVDPLIIDSAGMPAASTVGMFTKWSIYAGLSGMGVFGARLISPAFFQTVRFLLTYSALTDSRHPGSLQSQAANSTQLHITASQLQQLNFHGGFFTMGIQPNAAHLMAAASAFVPGMGGRKNRKEWRAARLAAIARKSGVMAPARRAATYLGF
jgi:hypothetical protein